jgi:Cu2+-exporting ATPase
MLLKFWKYLRESPPRLWKWGLLSLGGGRFGVSNKAGPVKQKRVVPFLGDVRNQQLEEFSPNAPREISQVEKLNNRILMIAIFSLGVTAAGRLFYSPLVFLSLPGIIYIGQFAFVSGCNTLIKEGTVTVDILYSVIKILLLLKGYIFLCSVSVFLFSINRKLLSKITNSSKKSIINVFKQQPSSVLVVRNGVELEIPFETLKTSDIVVVNAGGTIPVDGHIVKGIASIDQHVLTGESQPIEKEVGTKVFALTLVLSGKISIQVEQTGSKTTAAQIAQVLNQTINTKTDIQLWSKNMSDKTVLPTFLLSGLAFPFCGLTTSIAILNSHFKYRVTIASAIGILNYLNLASHKGLLIKDGRIFELVKRVDTIVFDKTGTLTEEQPMVGQLHSNGEYSEEEILRYAAVAESKQTHPIAKAILQKAKEQQLNLPAIDDASYQVGYGITVTVNNRLIRVGSIRFFEQERINITPKIRHIHKLCHEQGHPIVLVAIDNQAIGAIELQASLRPEVKTVIHELRQRNIKSMYIISGDHEAPTKKLAEELGIDHYFAETLPENKADLIEQFQKEGKSVCYIGDGINDSIALMKADVSISIRGASTVATDTAQIILMDQSLKQLTYLFDMAEQFDTSMKTTLAAVVVPSLISMGMAVFFSHLELGLIQSFIWPQIGLMAGLIIAMKHRLMLQPAIVRLKTPKITLVTAQ